MEPDFLAFWHADHPWTLEVLILWILATVLIHTGLRRTLPGPAGRTLAVVLGLAMAAAVSTAAHQTGLAPADLAPGAWLPLGVLGLVGAMVVFIAWTGRRRPDAPATTADKRATMTAPSDPVAVAAERLERSLAPLLDEARRLAQRGAEAGTLRRHRRRVRRCLAEASRRARTAERLRRRQLRQSDLGLAQQLAADRRRLADLALQRDLLIARVACEAGEHGTLCTTLKRLHSRLATPRHPPVP